MKQLLAICSVIGFVMVLGIGPALSQITELTGCFRDDKKNAKIGRVSGDGKPGKPCSSKQTQVTWPTDVRTDDLQAQIIANDVDIAQNASDISNNDGDIAQNASDISDNANKAAENMDRIDAIATVIGGSSGNNDLPNTDETRYMGMFLSRLRTSDRNVENRIPIAGTLTNFWVRQSGEEIPLTGDATRVFTVLLRAHPAEPVATTLTCTLALPGNEFVCADDVHCVNIVANRRITVEIDNNPNTGTLALVQANWSAKFTPGAICPVL